MPRGVKTDITDLMRAQARKLAAIGLSDDMIATVLEVSESTLKAHLADELHDGRIVANVRVAETLYSMATSGTNTAATIFWAKARMRWHEVHRVEMAEAPEVTDARERLAAKLAALVAAGAAAAGGGLPQRGRGAIAALGLDAVGAPEAAPAAG